MPLVRQTKILKNISQAKKIALYEGLPHQRSERQLFDKELQKKTYLILNDYHFYQEPLTLNDEDAKKLTKILSDLSAYMPFSGEKKCGGFHPDYAVQWENSYRALICFGCEEIKLFAFEYESRNDLGKIEDLQTILKKYPKNRPKPQIFGGKKK